VRGQIFDRASGQVVYNPVCRGVAGAEHPQDVEDLVDTALTDGIW
jgi:hypothetical protein